MRVLLDENLSHDLTALLEGHEADTVTGCGWPGVQNGEFLRLASARHDAFLTMDRRLPEEQRLDDLPFAVLLIVAPTNRMADIGPLVPRILEPLDSAEAGKVTVVAA